MPIHRLNKVLKNLDKLEAVVIMDDTPTIDHDKVITWREFLNKGKDIDEKQVLERADNIDLDDTSSIIYTSGTTGNPKGVELSHRNWSFLMEILMLPLKFNQGERTISWLPGAHVFG